MVAPPGGSGRGGRDLIDAGGVPRMLVVASFGSDRAAAGSAGVLLAAADLFAQERDAGVGAQA